jgi:hypothetical protein
MDRESIRNKVDFRLYNGKAKYGLLNTTKLYSWDTHYKDKQDFICIRLYLDELDTNTVEMNLDEESLDFIIGVLIRAEARLKRKSARQAEKKYVPYKEKES